MHPIIILKGANIQGTLLIWKENKCEEFIKSPLLI